MMIFLKGHKDQFVLGYVSMQEGNRGWGLYADRTSMAITIECMYLGKFG
jgi:hypothetical protein